MIKAILFDKDGTLFSLNTWAAPVSKTLYDVATKYHFNKGETTQKLLEELGIVNGRIQENSLLASSTNEEVFSYMLKYLTKRGIKIDKDFIPYFVERMKANTSADSFIPSCDLHYLLSSLKEKGYILGVATADSEHSTKALFKHFELLDYFTEYYTSLYKPEADQVVEFFEIYELLPEEVLLVGDSEVDMLLAKNLGAHPLMLASYETSSQYPTISHLGQIFDYIEKING